MSDFRAPNMADRPDRLIMVYNANAGWTSALLDAAHKLVRPETYQCSLCMISYGAVLMRRPWREYLRSLPMQTDFYHRQDFADAYPARCFPAVKGLDLPAILIETGSELHLLLNSENLDRLSDVDSLIAAVDQALDRFRT
ncbi:hypothetical protein [Parasphingorhabdus sp.]|uniref:hypothetical protein n=1 Tax=Parasphingorhabdus sp. TaxID=2709688 RepID=UPI0030028581